jgi:hypothetical protein
MTDKTTPFSARLSGMNSLVRDDFPPTARSGLIHLLFDLVDRDYVRDWGVIARELQRIGRLQPTHYDMTLVEHGRNAMRDAASILCQIEWQKALDFCERLHSHLAIDVGRPGEYGFEVTTPRADVQNYIANELQRLFDEERLALVFADGLVRRRGRKHLQEVADRASHVLGDPQLDGARRHYSKALTFFRDSTKPDYENCVKEAVCAVEAAAKTLFPEAGVSTLGDFAKWLPKSDRVGMPKALAQTFTGIYAYRSGGDGVGHGGSSGGSATAAVAEYVLGLCASQIVYLVDLAQENATDIPF